MDDEELRRSVAECVFRWLARMDELGRKHGQTFDRLFAIALQNAKAEQARR